LPALRYQDQTLAGDAIGRKLFDARAKECHLADDRADEAGERPHQGCLARAVGAQHSNKLAAGNLKRRVANDCCCPIAGRKSVHGQERFLVSGNRPCPFALGKLAGAEIGRTHRRFGRYFQRLSFGDLRAGIEHNDVTRNAHHQFHVMLDQDDSDADRGELAQQLVDCSRILCVEAGGRFVERQHGGTNGEGASDFYKTLIDMRQCASRRVEGARKADKCKQTFSNGDILFVVPGD